MGLVPGAIEQIFFPVLDVTYRCERGYFLIGDYFENLSNYCILGCRLRIQSINRTILSQKN